MISFHREDPKAGSNRFSGHFETAQVTDLKRIALCMSKFVWSPCIWEHGYRLQKNFLGATLCVLDFDDGEMTLQEAIDSFCDMQCIIGTTKSHQISKNGVICDRFRVVFKWECAVTDLRLYRYAMHQIMRSYPCDKSCKDGARFFYPCSNIVFLNDDPEAFLQEVPPRIPDTFEIYPDVAADYVDAGIIPSFFKRKFQRNYRKNNRHTAIYGYAKDLAKAGFPAERIVHEITSDSLLTVFGDVDMGRVMQAITNGIKAHHG